MNTIIDLDKSAFNRAYSFWIFFLSILAITFFAPAIINLISIWITRDDYSHGFFVIPITIYLVWHRRSRLKVLPIQPSWIGMPVLLLGALTYSAAFLARFHSLTYVSMIITIFGLLLFLTGWKWTRCLLLPLLFLAFMFPIPGDYYVLITNPLKLFVTRLSTDIIYFFGIPVYGDGNLLFFASTQLEVAEACSGLRSLFAYLMLGFLFATQTREKWKKLLLGVLAVLLALLVNVIRVVVTGILANFSGPEVADGFFHQFSGILLFFMGFVALFVVFRLVNAKSTSEKNA